MSEYIINSESLTATANAVREKTGGTEPIEWKENGFADEMEKVFEAGKKSEYDAFWDNYQKNGQRIEYSLAFAGDGWYDDNFRPKYDIVPVYSYEIFKLCRITNLEKILNDNHIKLDFSKSGRISGAFTTAQLLTAVPEIDASQVTYVALSSLFQDCFKLHTIRKLKLRQDGSNTFSACFYRCNSLKNIVVEGTIGTNIDFQHSPLSNGSISSIINALSNSSAGTSVIFSLAAVNTAFETSSGAANGSTSSEWLELTATKPNWTFSLV